MVLVRVVARMGVDVGRRHLAHGLLDQFNGFAAIGDAAAKGDEVSIPGFGKFKVKHSPAREGRNPSTGAAMKIAASRKLGFTVAKAIKDKLNG